MSSCHCISARTERDILDAQRLRWTVYGEEERMLPPERNKGGRETDPRDLDDTTIHFIAYADREPAGTVRLLQSGRLGLDLPSKLDLTPLSAPGAQLAEVTRFCVPRRYRSTGVTSALFLTMLAESLRRGITHWVAAANMETDCPEDAAIAFRVARERGLLHDRLGAALRVEEPPPTSRLRPYYTAEQRSRAEAGDLTGLPLPRTLQIFANRMGARFIGSPVYDAYFNIFALPLIASLADIAALHA